MSSLNYGCPDCGALPLRFCKSARIAGVGDPRIWDSCAGRIQLAGVAAMPVDKALTLWQPWSWVIAHGGTQAKRIENRDWPPPASIIGKRLAIHAGQVTDTDAVDYLTNSMGFAATKVPRKRGKPTVAAMSTTAFGWTDDAGDILTTVPLANGAIESVGTVLGAVHESGKVVGLAGLTELAVSLMIQDPYFSGSWGWFLVDVVTLPRPIACKGAQGLWPIRLAERQQLAEAMQLPAGAA